MSTTGIDTWAVDLADIGPIYPFQGTEVLLAVLGVAAWLGWQVWCIGWEKAYHREKIARYGDAESLKRAIDDNH